MYEFPELSTVRATQLACWTFRRLFFSIYYRTPDNAFRRAAATWRRAVQTQEAFNPGQDLFIEREVLYETDFTNAWNEICCIACRCCCQVWVGHILTHSSKDEDGGDGLEFRRSGDAQQYHTLTRSEIVALPQLPWSRERGYLILAGCNTGLEGERGWCPARTFYSTQGVPVLGQQGYAYFSREWGSYTESAPTDTSIALWAYRRGKNGAFGDGARIRARVFS